MLNLIPASTKIILFLFLFAFPISAIRSFPNKVNGDERVEFFGRFDEAPEFRNGEGCHIVDRKDSRLVCNPNLVHIAMTLDKEYLRGSIAAIHSVLKHSSCPENVFFHFIASEANLGHLNWVVQSTFPSLNFKVYLFKEDLVNTLISSSVREALENPLNYARSYLGEILEPCVERVIYLDSDVIVVEDIQKLWRISLSGSRVIGAPEYCHVNFTNYFTDNFWFDAESRFSKVFEGKMPCYFNTGVLVMDLVNWREGGYTKKIEEWMRIQKEKRIYELGSLPPFLLVFGGEVEGIDHRWNQHGLGGDNTMGKCRTLHPGPVSLLHWSGKGKPWVRLDAAKPCPVDYLWAPYDLYRHHGHHHQQKRDNHSRVIL